MRTTLAIDSDALDSAKQLAASRRQSLGAVVSELIRKGLESKPVFDYADGVPVFRVSGRARKISSEDVKRLDDEA